MKYLLLILLSTNVLAGEYDILFTQIETKQGKYNDAVSKARQAFMIQTGVEDNYSKLKQYATKQLELVIEKVGVKNELAVALYGYRIYREKSVNLPIGHGKRLTLQLDQVKLSIPF